MCAFGLATHSIKTMSVRAETRKKERTEIKWTCVGSLLPARPSMMTDKHPTDKDNGLNS